MSDIEIEVVVPVRNEVLCIRELYEKVKQQLSPLGLRWRLLFVDDGSIDKSWQLIEQLHALEPECVAGIRLSRCFGKEAAIRAGLCRSTAHAVIVMDGDLQHPPAVLPKMISEWQSKQIDIVEAIRGAGGVTEKGLLYSWCSSFLYSLLERLTGMQFQNQTDFRLLSRRAVNELRTLPEKDSLFRGLVMWTGLSTTQIEYQQPERFAGQSQWQLFSLISLAIDTITGFTTLPLRIMTLCSMLFIAFSFVLIVQTSYNYFVGTAVEGFTTVIISILMVGGVLAAGLGIIGEYLSRIYNEVKQRPMYIVQETTEAEDEPVSISLSA